MERTPWDPEGVETLLDAEGALVRPDAASGLDLRALYKKMVGARSLDLRLSQLGLPMWASAAGEEAALVPLGLALDAEDWLYPSARDAAALFGRGIAAGQVARRALGLDGRPKIPGDLSFPEHNIAPLPESLGLHLLVASGHARAQKLSGSGAITAASFGEGTSTTGAFHEALCMAAHGELPLVFVCKSQEWPDGAPDEAGSLGDPVADRARAYGLWTRRVDGADPLSCQLAMDTAIERARAGDGPSLVEVVVTQLAHDPPAHRDPIERLRRRIDADGQWTQTFQDVIEAEVRGQLDEVVNEYEARLHGQNGHGSHAGGKA